MLRDQLIFEERKDLAGEKCLICGQMNHENKSCKTLFFIPNRLDSIHILDFTFYHFLEVFSRSATSS
jgi:hypothetical protein